jgi:DNA topoisomerase-1
MTDSITIELKQHSIGGITHDFIAMDEFDESKIERDENGRFSVTGASGKVTGKSKKEGGKGTKVTYVDSKGKPLADKHQARLRALAVPPAWTNIRLAKDPKAALQVKGTDAKGREQSRYSKQHTDKAASAKFARLKEFTKQVPKIAAAIEKDAKKGNVTALAQRAILLTGFRPGSTKETGAEKKAYGITTITGRHIKVKGDQVTFKFPGKSGKENEKTIKDPILAKYLKDKVGSKEPVFPNTNGNKLGLYLKSVGGREFKTKDFRTWQGTSKAIQLVGNKQAKSMSEFHAIQKEVAKGVAAHLGNTPAVALASYISPMVWDKVRPMK